MLVEQEMRLADIAVELQILDRATMDRVVQYLASQPQRPPLVQYLAQSGKISPQQIDQLKAEWQRRASGSGTGSSGRLQRPDSAPQAAPPQAAAPQASPPQAAAPQASPPPMAPPPMAAPAGNSGQGFGGGPAGPPSSAEIKADEYLAKALIAWNAVGPDQLRACHQEQMQRGLRLGGLLVEKGYATEEQVLKAYEVVFQTFRPCSGCDYVHDMRGGPADSCPQCRSPFLADSRDRQLNKSAGPAPQAFAPPPGPGGPAGPPSDPDDPFSQPVGYDPNAKDVGGGLLATSSINRRQLKGMLDSNRAPEPSPPPADDSSDEFNLGLSTDELAIFSGASGDDINVNTPGMKSALEAPPSAEQSAEAPPSAEAAPAAAPAATAPARRAKAKPAKAEGKKGCGKKAAALLAMVLLPFGLAILAVVRLF